MLKITNSFTAASKVPKLFFYILTCKNLFLTGQRLIFSWTLIQRLTKKV